MSSFRTGSQLLQRLTIARSATPTRFRRPLGVLLVIASGGVLLASTPLFPDFKQRYYIYNDSSTAPEVPKLPVDPNTIRVDPDTQTPFPVLLQTQTPSNHLALIGLGVRKVSFLRVKVYSVGFYVEESGLRNLDDIPGWHTFTAKHLLTPPTPDAAGPQLHGEILMRNLLDRPISCAIRIVPVRNTDFSHLRDGFTRAIQQRTKLARSQSRLSEEEEQRINEKVQELKSLFPKEGVPKGKALNLIRDHRGDLTIEYEGKRLGSISDQFISRELFMAYFADKDEISPKLKEDVAAGLEAYIKH